MSGPIRRRLALALAAFVPAAAGVVLALRVAGEAVERGEAALLRSEAAIAASLHAEAAGARDPREALDAAFGDRWRRTERVDSLLDRSEVAEAGGRRTARTTLFGPDGWTRVGTLELRGRADRSGGTPWPVLLAAGLGLLLLLAGLLAICLGDVGPAEEAAGALGERDGRGPRRTAPAATARGERGRWKLLAAALAALALLVTAGSLWRVGGRAEGRLAQASELRLDAAVRALEATPDLPALAGRPGAVARLTGLSSVLLDPAGGVARTTLLPGRAEAVAALASPPPERTEIDRATYEVREVGPVRLAAVPYDHTMDPRAEMAGLTLGGLVLGALPLALLPVVGLRRRLRENLVAWSFLAPAGLHLLVFTLGPLAFAGWLSLHRWSLVEAARPFVGLANYAGLLGDGAFWNAIGNTVLFTLHVPVAMVVALGFALLVRQRTRGSRWVRTALFLPSITSLVAIAIVWQWMLNDQYGLLNWLLSSMGLGRVGWLTNPDVALWSLMLMYVWLIVGYQMVLFQAGLAAIPEQLYEAARIDGAGPWRRLVHVTIPGLRHTIFFVLVTSVIGSFQVFGAVYVMTEGGPLGSTDVAVFHIYREAWEFLRFGNAAAMSWVLFALLFVVTWVHFRLLERRSAGAAA